MINNCREFEERIQQLMDDRIDPETDEAVCAHTSICSDCYESMMAYSLMHTSYLNDSDSMKIKLEHLGLHQALNRQSHKPNRKKLFAIAASIAAMILLFAALTSGMFDNDNRVPVASFDGQSVTPPPIYQVDFESFRKIKESIETNDLVLYGSDLPGIKPFRALSIYLRWVQESLLNFTQEKPAPSKDSTDGMLKFELNGSYSYKPRLLCSI